MNAVEVLNFADVACGIFFDKQVNLDSHQLSTTGIMMKNAKKRLVALPVLLLVVVGIVAWNYARRDRGDTVIRLSGNMEVTSVALGFRIPGWLRERLVNEGERESRPDS